jgi:hypothetical protein
MRVMVPDEIQVTVAKKKQMKKVILSQKMFSQK